MRRIVIGMSAGVMGLLLSACPPPYPKCSSDEQCKEHGEVCVQGQCQECVADQNCKTGFVCQANKCVPKPEAKPAALAPGACNTDTDCGDGGRCRGNKCLAKGVCEKDTDCGDGQKCEAGSCKSKADDLARCDWAPLHFGFNDYNLTPDAQKQLSDLAECIKASKKKITLEGHADERGTEEYNLQLSNRRAAAVKKYLTDLGVDASELGTVGYGKTQPLDPGHSEEAWAKNRRVQFAGK